MKSSYLRLWQDLLEPFSVTHQVSGHMQKKLLSSTCSGELYRNTQKFSLCLEKNHSLQQLSVFKEADWNANWYCEKDQDYRGLETWPDISSISLVTGLLAVKFSFSDQKLQMWPILSPNDGHFEDQGKRCLYSSPCSNCERKIKSKLEFR